MKEGSILVLVALYPAQNSSLGDLFGVIVDSLAVVFIVIIFFFKFLAGLHNFYLIFLMPFLGSLLL